MDIYLNEIEDTKAGFAFPSLPDKIKVTSGANYQSFTIIGQGNVKVPRGTEVGKISWNGVFFGQAKQREAIVKNWIAPAECKNILEGWLEKGTVLRLMVTCTNINYDVTISNFEYTETGGYGNAEYTISLARYKPLKIYTTTELNIQSYVKKVAARPAPKKSSSKTYTIVSGDNLWNIARKYYGDGTQWQKIYNANSAVLESAAQKYGHSSSDNGSLIFPGTSLTIP